MAKVYIIDASGEKEEFSADKVYESAKRAGASLEVAREIAQEIGKEVYDGIKTFEIFKRVKELLSIKMPKASLRFNLKEGIRRLGPTGFPFERFTGEVFKSLGFKVETNLHIPGFCLADYEIDFVAQKGKELYIGECKYRNLSGDKVHSKDALANYARFLDIKKGPYFKESKNQGYQIRTVLVTNTKFTDDARNYSACMGVYLLGWRYPKDKGLEAIIEESGLYPITILPSAAGYLKDVLVSEQIMLAKDVLKIEPNSFSKKFKIPARQINSLIKEAKLLLGG